MVDRRVACRSRFGVCSISDYGIKSALSLTLAVAFE